MSYYKLIFDIIKGTFNNKSFWSAELLDTSKSARGDYRHCPFGDIRPRTNILEAAGGNKKCVAFEFQNDKVVVFAADCNLEKYFICKVFKIENSFEKL